MTVTNSINLDEIVQWSPNMMLEISLPKKENFLQVKETLTRMGIASHKDKVLYQSCHILHKNKPSTNTELLENKEHYYYIVHFKEMFALDGRNTNISVGDIRRRNRIASLLCEWGLVDFPDVCFSGSSGNFVLMVTDLANRNTNSNGLEIYLDKTEKTFCHCLKVELLQQVIRTSGIQPCDEYSIKLYDLNVSEFCGVISDNAKKSISSLKYYVALEPPAN